ncbi:MAG: lysylphosphatidylglycerol synthase transmembrane domain-containing protein [Myxococcota bacterium]|nr:lysylphosphatidylglycerol synthase transmembrane domain-containing protein [Myxococcota bacterium]
MAKLPNLREHGVVGRRILYAYALAGISLALLAWLVRGHWGDLRQLSNLPPGPFVGIIALYLVGRGLSAEAMRMGLSGLGFPLARSICFMLTLLQSYTNLIIPRSGLAPPAVYLRVQHGVPYTVYLAFAVLMILLTTGLMGGMGFLAGWMIDGEPDSIPVSKALWFFAGLCGAAALAVAAPVRLFGVLPEWPRRHLLAAHAAWSSLAGRPSMLIRLMGLQAAGILLRGVRMKVALEIVGVQVSFGQVMVVSICTDLSMLVSLTPAALGFREAGVLFGAAMVGIEPGAAMLAAIIDRLATTPTVIVAGQLVLWRGVREVLKGSDGQGEQPSP